MFLIILKLNSTIQQKKHEKFDEIKKNPQYKGLKYNNMYRNTK